MQAGGFSRSCCGNDVRGSEAGLCVRLQDVDCGMWFHGDGRHISRLVVSALLWCLLRYVTQPSSQNRGPGLMWWCLLQLTLTTCSLCETAVDWKCSRAAHCRMNFKHSSNLLFEMWCIRSFIKWICRLFIDFFPITINTEECLTVKTEKHKRIILLLKNNFTVATAVVLHNFYIISYFEREIISLIMCHSSGIYVTVWFRLVKYVQMWQ